jgi:hypothetical protein
MAKSKSRQARFDEALAKIGEGKGEIECLRDELQSWLDNLPENLQSGSKADALTTAIDELENIVSELDNIEGTSVEFPTMFS